MRKRLVGCCWCYSTATTLTTQRLYVFLTLLFLLAFHSTPGVSDSVPASTKYKEVTSVAGSVGQIPCPVTSFDEVVMILWFKGSSGAPIYSYDARNDGAEPRHMTLRDDWGLRLYFRVWPNNKRHPALMIQELKPRDGGLYRCRVDYRNSPTTNSVTRLKIIEPPTRLEIRDTSPTRPISDQQMMISGSKHSDPSVTYMGPYSEGQNVTLVCSAYGGKPLPEVRWYKNGDMVDTAYSLSGTEYTINEMTINNLGRNHTFDIYSCQANNNNETQALTHKVHLEIYLGVTSVELEVPSPMTAGSEYSIACKSIGAYPTVKVEFWKNLKRIASRSQMKSIADNITITSIQYKPEVGDDGTIMICKAENPWVSKKPSVARKTMKIKYAPVTILRLGRNRTTAFSEGESVLMECHVKANPPAHTIMWFHQGRQLGIKNETSGIRLNGMTLFISYLNYRIGGDYNCEAVNDVGKGISNNLAIELQLSPKCVTSEAAQVPLAIGETQWLTCNILAWPSDLNFYWTLNRSDSSSSGGGGEIRGSTSTAGGTTFRNLTEYYRLPILSVGAVARGANNSVPTSTTIPMNGSSIGRGKSNLKNGGKDAAVMVAEKAEQQHRSSNQTGYPMLSAGSSSESLDYPEDQHMPHHDASTINAMTDNIERTRSGALLLTPTRTTAATGRKEENKEKRSSQKDILFGKIYSTGEKAILTKENEKSGDGEAGMNCTSPSDAVFSTSRDASPSSNNFNVSNLSFPASAKLTSDIGTNTVAAVKNDKDGETKTKRHVYPSSSSSYFGNVDDGKIRDGTAHRFQDKIRHRSLIPYQVKSNEDYGTVACWATNSLGSQVVPCLFHIVKKEDEDSAGRKGSKDQRQTSSGSKTKGLGSTSDKKHIATSVNLTAFSSSVSNIAASADSTTTTGKKPVENKLGGSEELESESPPYRGFSKLQKTSGIVLLLILIFIASLSGLAFVLLFLLAKRRREIRRIVVAHGAVSRVSSVGSRSRPSSNGSFCSSGNNKSTTNKNGKCTVASAAAAHNDNDDAVNKNAPGENTFLGKGIDDDGGFVATFLPSDMMFAVATSTITRNRRSFFSVNPFQDIAAGDRENIENPQPSYISTDTTTFSSGKNTQENNAVGSYSVPGAYSPVCPLESNMDDSDCCPANNATLEQTKVNDVGDPFVARNILQSASAGSSSCNDHGCCTQKTGSVSADEVSLQTQGVGDKAEEGFNSMTPRARELLEHANSSASNQGGSIKQDEGLVSSNDRNNLSFSRYKDGNNTGIGSGEDNAGVREQRDHLDNDSLPVSLDSGNALIQN